MDWKIWKGVFFIIGLMNWGDRVRDGPSITPLATQTPTWFLLQ